MNVAEPYIVTEPPAESPISLDEFKLWAKISGTAEDSLIQQIIDGVTLEAEKYTKRDFITRTYQTFRNVFGDIAETPQANGGYHYLPNRCPITLRRTPLDEVNFINYEVDEAETAFDLANIRIVTKEAFSKLVPIQSSQWPTNVDQIPQAITIEFTAGYGDATAVPADIKNALLAHATSVYQNRGDCDNGGGSCSCKFAPAEAMAVYNQYRIIDFRA